MRLTQRVGTPDAGIYIAWRFCELPGRSQAKELPRSVRSEYNGGTCARGQDEGRGLGIADHAKGVTYDDGST